MMRAPGQSTYDPSMARAIAELEKKVGILNRRQLDMPKIPPPVIAGGGGPLGSTRLTATSWSSGGGVLFIDAYSAAPTPTPGGQVPPGWAPPQMFYPGPDTQWAAAPVPAESGWYQASAHAYLAFSGGAPTEVTLQLVTAPSTYYSTVRVDGGSVSLGAASLPWYQHGGDPTDIYSGNLWVQFEWAGSASVASRSQIWIDIVRLG
jgi:hypothetical protein